MPTIPDFEYLEADLHSCKLCEWRCCADRLEGQTGVCGITHPKVASSQLHPAPPASFDAFLLGCNFKCISCQNWSISMYNEAEALTVQNIEGYYPPSNWAEFGLTCLTLPEAQHIQADRLFFTGGEPTCSLPWVEAVVQAARQIIPETKVNFDTNGYLTKDALHRVLEFTNSITYDLKAITPEVFQALTGARVKPVLRNLKEIIKNEMDKLWEVRVMVIPGVHEHECEMDELCKFLADIDTTVKLNFLAFRPNFVMEDYFGATEELLDHCISVAKKYGLSNVSWSGLSGIKSKIPKKVKKIMKESARPEFISLPLAYSKIAGCVQESRNCGKCDQNQKCLVRSYKVKDFHHH
jgi:pyruvate formate lyase activating enzyme